jgi:fatty acid desaturase
MLCFATRCLRAYVYASTWQLTAKCTCIRCAAYAYAVRCKYTLSRLTLRHGCCSVTKHTVAAAAICLPFVALSLSGHDCGHTTFSNYTVVNDICGHLCHAPLLVPFWPWAQSHHQHHSYHNHVDKDHSFPWFRKEQYATEVSDFGRSMLKTPFHPLFTYGIAYLMMGYWDGSHFNPMGNLFKTRYSIQHL